MAGTRLTSLKLLKDFLKMMPENSSSITDIGYSTRMKRLIKGIALCLNLWSDSRLRFKKRSGIENEMPWNMKKMRRSLSMLPTLKKYISE